MGGWREEKEVEELRKGKERVRGRADEERRRQRRRGGAQGKEMVGRERKRRRG
jgi:hypothetical protein